MEDGEIIEDAEAAKDVKMRDSLVEGDVVANQIDKKPSDWQQSGRSRRDFTKQAGKTVRHVHDYSITSCRVLLRTKYVLFTL